MKTKHLSLGITLNTVLMVVGAYAALQTIAFFRDNIFFGLSGIAGLPAAVFAFLGPNVIPPAIIFGLILFLACLPLQKIQTRLEAGEVLDPQVLEKTRLRLLGFSRLLIIINLLGFTLGFVIQTIISGQAYKFLWPSQILVLCSNLSAGASYAIAQTALNNIKFSRLRQLLGMQEIGQRRRETAVTTRQVILTGLLVFYAISYIQLSTNDYLIIQATQTEVLASVQQGSISADQAEDTYRQKIMAILPQLSSRKDIQAAQIAIPWRSAPAVIDIQRKGFFLLGALFLIITLGIQLAASSELRQQIKNLLSSLSNVLKGGGDLRQRLNIQSMDEIGELSDLINQTLAHVQGMVQRISQATEQTRIGSEAIAKAISTAEEGAQLTNNAATAFAQELEVQVHNSRSLIQTTEDFKQAAERVFQAESQQEVALEQTRKAMRDMAENINTVGSQTARSASLTQSLSEKGNSGQQAVQETAQAILEIKTTSAELLRVLTILKSIAASTNLLAMNAAIEAAHAGEQGQGFAVVADEVRSLASTASQQTKTIKGLIDTMNQRVEAGVQRADAAGHLISDLVNGLQEAANISTQISTAMAKQDTDSQSVANYLDQLFLSAKSIRDRMNEQNTSSAAMEAGLNLTLNTLKAMADSSHKQAEMVKSINQSFGLVRQQVEKTSQRIDTLGTEIGNFQV